MRQLKVTGFVSEDADLNRHILKQKHLTAQYLHWKENLFFPRINSNSFYSFLSYFFYFLHLSRESIISKSFLTVSVLIGCGALCTHIHSASLFLWLKASLAVEGRAGVDNDVTSVSFVSLSAMTGFQPNTTIHSLLSLVTVHHSYISLPCDVNTNKLVYLKHFR